MLIFFAKTWKTQQSACGQCNSVFFYIQPSNSGMPNFDCISIRRVRCVESIELPVVCNEALFQPIFPTMPHVEVNIQASHVPALCVQHVRLKHQKQPCPKDHAATKWNLSQLRLRSKRWGVGPKSWASTSTEVLHGIVCISGGHATNVFCKMPKQVHISQCPRLNSHSGVEIFWTYSWFFGGSFQKKNPFPHCWRCVCEHLLMGQQSKASKPFLHS